jgi:enamine deaminase RidA (YjgF/YER057c/UK114 family)
VQQKYKASLAMMQVRTTIEAKLMSPEFLVEIDIVAAVQ